MSVAAKIDARGFARSIDKAIVGLDRELVESLDRAEDAALESMTKTPTFQDRTGSLRSAFQSHGADLEERLVEIDEGAANPTSKTPPNVYGRFLNFGTRFISPRGFAEAAREQAEQVLDRELERRLARVFR